MPFELDHVFVAASVDAPEILLLRAAGFTDTPAHDHPGQGTASRRIFFENAYLELIWLTDARAAGSPPVLRTGLRERADPTRTGSPFGFGLRFPRDPMPDPPFETWRYSPAYLPEGMAFEMAANSDDPRAPLIFVLPLSRVADWTAPAHPNGVERLTDVGLAPGPMPPSDVMSAFFGLGLVSRDDGPEPVLRLEWDHRAQGRTLDLRPHLPLTLAW
jgi:hypothetical protein